ncbi:Glycoside hydrolase, 38 vacuolar alpha mannosidase [Orbilia ellipsospora]|uniref:Alpha-mannosidase n=1 Tax=Orbilia ellipsospora TaxID=2528407 RepID=A0AAV9X1V5_9PEZI
MGGETREMAGSSYPKLATEPKGQQIHNIYLDRLRMFTSGGQYVMQNLPLMYDADRESGPDNVKIEVWSAPNMDRPTFAEAVKANYRPSKKGEWFGPSWSTHWFRLHLTVPERMRDKWPVEFRWDANCESMVWSEDGCPLQGLTGGGERTKWRFPKDWLDGKERLIYIELACNRMFGNTDGIAPPNMNAYFNLHEADFVVPNEEASALYYDFWMIGDAAREFPKDSWESHEALQVATRIMNAYRPGDQESVLKGREIAGEYLGKLRDSHKVYETDTKPIVFATGHCHIDTCWLWPWDETKRKVARSWSSQIELMDRYPEHRFTCSQAQQYKWLQQYYPPLYEKVKAKVKSGQFQPIGGSWVEHDTNMPSGESLVRQFICGQRFFESRFGSRCETFWLPDTFGYSSQIPQLCRLAGMTRFFTQKLSWNNINNFPHTTFNWVALDGSQVLCHMPPSETYTADAHFGDVKRSMSQHKSLDQDTTSLLVFGKGDGGGGPTSEMLEKLRRLRGMADTVGLLPRVQMGSSVDDFFRALEKKAENGTSFVTWYGELYFELHRGTYTTQSKTKWHVRKGEFLLHDIEYLATHASLANKDYKYPKKDIDDLWEDMCLSHFHDCLPGSSIEMVYQDADKMFDKFFHKGEQLIKEALEALGVKGDAAPGLQPVSINTHGWKRKEVAKVGEKLTFVQNDGFGFGKVVKEEEAKVGVKEVESGVFVMSNSRFNLKVDQGVITSIYDTKVDRELIPAGRKANQYVIMDDKPLYWQAWDVEVYHLDQRTELPPGKVSILENGPNRASVLVETKISDKSWIKSTISLDADNGAQATEDALFVIGVECEVEWHETMKFLKVEFPVDIKNTEASYECQYGIVRRPTHYNTSWDMAKFEVCCHKWADLSEATYGVSILNDCKYGFAVAGNTMRLSLIRAPKAPDAHADMGHHKIRYAIAPHEGPLDHRIVRAGYDWNNPVRVQYSEPSNKVAVDGVWLTGCPNIVLDHVKRGEDDEEFGDLTIVKRKGNSVVIRLFDSMGGKSKATINSKWDIKKITKCNVLEDDLEEVEVMKCQEEGTWKADVWVRAFEVATYRLWL